MTKIKSAFLLTALQTVIQILQVNCTPATEFYHPHLQNDSINIINSVPNFVPATTVERVETFSNGCFKQTIKEADLSDMRRFIETDQLICPPGINATSVTILTNQLQQNTSVVPGNAPFVQPPIIVPVNDTHIAVLPPPSRPTALLPPVLTMQKNEPTSMNIQNVAPANAPVVNPPHIVPVDPAPIAVYPVITQHKNEPSVVYPSIIGHAPNTTTSQVVNLSQKYGYYDHGKKTNGANSLYNVNFLLAFVFFSIFSNFM